LEVASVKTGIYPAPGKWCVKFQMAYTIIIRSL